MFVGESEHPLDDKGRLILPAKWREPFAEGAYVSREIDGCLSILTPDEFTVVATDMALKMKGSPTDRAIARTFAGGTAEVVPDRQGRIAIPAGLREFAGLVDRVVITGQITKLEVWAVDAWAAVQRVGDAALREEETVDAADAAA